ncbi:hypothetical protein K435DRAFT_658793, partial [Dendrothele bispora CBS 962.96]
IIENKTFQSKLIHFTVDEAHLIPSWGKNFRPCFSHIGSFAQGCVPILTWTATLVIGSATSSICVSKYAQLLNYLHDGQKTVIHVNTIPEAYRIYKFLWDYIPNEFNHL